MKKITCEMCGGKDLIKQNGVYVCQYCGTQYSIEEAKRLMIEGTVDVSGSKVEIDSSKELENLYKIARRAKDDNNSENASKYYDMILLKDPDSWEANFYSVYYKAMGCTIAQIEAAGILIINCLDTVLLLLKEHAKSKEDQGVAIVQILFKCIDISDMLYNAAKSHYEGIDTQIRSNYTQEMINNCFAAKNIMYHLGDCLEKQFGDNPGIMLLAAQAWENGVDKHNYINGYLKNKEANKEVILKYISKAKKYDEKYSAPEINMKNAEGCYVATAVYGSYDCPQVWTLRRFRDYTLAKSCYGRAFIYIYYAVSPNVVKLFGKNSLFKKFWKKPLDYMVKYLNDSGVESTPYKDRNW